MGYLLKEALKTLCGVNQWSYAVFWKTGCQNPKLLIWEECYCGPASCPRLPENSGNGNPEIAFEDYKVHLLVNKMMMDNYINIVGEGLVGRVAFTGNHQWILSEKYYTDSHPPEVLKELCRQFSAGIKTVTVIPVSPHGVVQFGSCSTISENMGFINDVVSLVLQLGYIPGVLQSENFTANELAPWELPLESNTNKASSFMADSQISYSLAREIQNEMQSSVGAPQATNSSPSCLQPHDYHKESRISGALKSDFSCLNQFMNGVTKAEVIPSNSDIWMNKHSSDIPDSVDHLTTNPFLASCSSSKCHHVDKKFAQSELNPCKEETENLFDDACFQPQSGDDLFDVLGADFKNKIFSNCWNSRDKNNTPTKTSPVSSDIYSIIQGNSDSGIFSSSCTDHLLDAVVSKIHSAKPILDDNLSCSTTLTSMSSSSAPKASSLPYWRFGVSDHVKGELLGIPNYLAKERAISSSSLRTVFSKEDSRTYSQGSSVYDPWIEKGRNMKRNNSVATGYSSKPHETTKTNRKRLKPGENPRPRPKDRQMIQDRVKELREIVPNGAKCSIDGLLERTIKHMLFLQSVTKHAEKLKQTAESKIISKDNGLRLKDNFGGATWAYEVGSQSMVCPIIVEELNQPHQMLVEMLCEERGLFLEIADIIRGLGLTILKGLMETRDNKIWACFAVEANRDVTRMEIFFSLVRLLEQNSKTGVQQPNKD